MKDNNRIIALAGNPNVGKSTVFNALTGLHQHTGNWPGKTVECKAGNHVKAKSMMVYMEKYDPVYAIRISTRNFGMVKGIKSVPLYSVFCT